ncbi:MAG: GSCFA domain-containing protein [Bacteroidaceae bacterium]
MKLITEVSLHRGELSIAHDKPILLMGSCFTEEIGGYLLKNKFTTLINPFGILYNPLSIAKALTLLLSDKLYTQADLHYDGELYYSFMHHSSFSNKDATLCLEKINQQLIATRKQLATTQTLIITYGTAYTYFLKETAEVVANCHKLPAALFTRRLLDVEEMKAATETVLAQLLKRYPQLHLLFTVSPIRHAKDGFPANQISKSTLLLGIHKLGECFPKKMTYFPAYEIVMDELRDYRFYAADMTHPSALTVAYIWEKFTQCYFSNTTQTFMKEWQQVAQGIAHRPFSPESEKYKSFLRQIVLKIARLKEKYPYLDVEKERTICHTLLKE